MKTIFLFIGVSLIFNFGSFAQMHDHPPDKIPERLQQLEKIKLIETLEMDEETTLRFFSRKAENKKVIDDLIGKADSLIEQIGSILSGEKNAPDEELKKLINEVSLIQTQIEKSKSWFINSLDDLLSTRQIAKLIVFEKNFREELRRVLFRDRKFRNKY
jgi:hypothetical protein